MKTAAAMTFSAEFACERRCQVEVDLDDVNFRCTVNQLRASAEAQHTEAHRHLFRVFRPTPNVLVRASVATGALT